MRSLVLIAVVLTASASAAQVSPGQYYPLGIGDTWTFAEEEVYTEGTTTCDPYELQGYQRTTVLRDTTLGGEPYRVVSCQSLSIDGAGLGESTYIARSTDAGRLEIAETLHDGGGCHPFTGPGDPSHTTEETTPDEVEVSGTTYPVAGVRHYAQAGIVGSDLVTSWWYGAGIGPVLYRSGGTDPGPPQPYCQESQRRLVYAVVGGETYGANPVRTGASPHAPVSLRVRAYPQPSRGPVTVALDGDAPGAVRLDVFDPLGRRIHTLEARSGEALSLDLSAWPPGLYLLRASGDEGTAVTPLVRAR